MIYTTLKQNKKENIDIAQYVDETITQIGYIFGEDDYIDKYGYTDFKLPRLVEVVDFLEFF